MSITLNGHGKGAALIADLKAQGFTLTLGEGDRVFISPRARLTEEQMEAVRASKSSVLAILRGEADPTPEPEPEPEEIDRDDTPELQLRIAALEEKVEFGLRCLDQDDEPEIPASVAIEPDTIKHLYNMIGGGFTDFHEKLSRDFEYQVGEPIRGLMNGVNEDIAHHVEEIVGRLGCMSEELGRDLRSNFERAACGVGSDIEEAGEEVSAAIQIRVAALEEKVEFGLRYLDQTLEKGLADVAGAIRGQGKGDPVADGMLAAIQGQGQGKASDPPKPPKRGKGGAG